jgi:hypothetical protein
MWRGDGALTVVGMTRTSSALAERTARETAYLLLDLPVGIAGFTVMVACLATGVSLAITLVGVPLLAGTLLLARYAAAWERQRARALLGVSLEAPPAPAATGSSLVHRLFSPLRDRANWSASGYFLLLLPVGTVTFSAAITWWATAVFLLTLPAWSWALPEGSLRMPDGGAELSGFWELAGASAGGLLLLALTPFVIHASTHADRSLLRLVGTP